MAVSLRSRLRLAEWLLLGYLGITSAVALVRLPGFPPMAWVLLANILYAILIFLAARPELGRGAEVLRDIYPILLLGALYPALDILNYFGGISTHDLTVRGWEVSLFGEELSRTWWQRSPSVAWSTVFHAAYFAYYPIIVAPLAVFLIRGNIAAARRAALWLVTTFLLSYLVFLAYPVAGPYYEFPRPDPSFLNNPAARLVYATLERGSAYGAAFPSSHVAAALVATAASFHGSRLLGWLLVMPSIMLAIGVVYCQMHYAVDAVAGILLAAMVIGAGKLLERGTGGATLFTE